jgi:NADH-quinone oxidoreductase subunit E
MLFAGREHYLAGRGSNRESHGNLAALTATRKGRALSRATIQDFFPPRFTEGRSGFGAPQRGASSILTSEEIREIEEEAGRYPTREAAGIDALRIAQRHRGQVSDEVLRDVAVFLGRSPAKLDGVATFYNLLFRRPVGRHVVLICDSVVCWAMGYEQIRQRLTSRLGVDLGQMTADGRFTLLPSVCLGACDRAPVLMVDGETHFGVAPDALDALLERYRHYPEIAIMWRSPVCADWK